MSLNVLLLTTCILDESNFEDLSLMLQSYKNTALKSKHIVLLQGDRVGFESHISKIEKYADIIYSGEIISLSKARNIMISYIENRYRIANFDLIAFPDDDCWYPSDNLVKIVDMFKNNQKMDLFVCRYSRNTVDACSAELQPLRVKQLIKYGSSVTIFVRCVLIDASHFFDEQLGIGSPNNGGEDLDFSLRVFVKSRNSFFSDAALVGHADKLEHSKPKYFQGGFKALRKNSRLHYKYFFYCVKKIFVGVYYVLRYKMSFKNFFDASA